MSLCIFQVYKVTHVKSGEIMVLKELYRVDEKAQKNFLKEVSNIKYQTSLKLL